MAKPFKIFLTIVGLLVVLVVGAAIAVPLFFDPNDYKPQVTAAVKENTGRDLTIAGDIELSVFPWLGVSLADVTLGNAQGFGPEPFARLKAMDVRVKLLPLLLKRQVEVGKVSVEGLAVSLVRDKDGRGNWEDLVKATDGDETPAQPPAEQPAPPVALAVGALDIRDVSLGFDDRQAGKSYKLEQLSLQTGKVTLEDPIELTLAFLATASEPEVSADVKLSLTAHHDLDAQVYEARGLSLTVAARGKAVPDGKQDLSVKGDVRYDQKAGVADLTGVVLEAMGARVNSNIRFDQNTGIADLTQFVAEARDARISSTIRFDQKADSVAVNDAVVEAAGVKVTGALQGAGVTGDTPRFTGKFASNSFNPREVAKKFQVELPPMADPTALTAVSFATDVTGDLKSARLDNLRLKLDQSTATGFVHVTDFATQSVQFALKLDAIDADRYLAPPAPDAEKAKDDGDFRKTELPIAALDQVNARGQVQIGSLTLKKSKLSDVVLSLDAPKGKVKTQELKARLYGGTLAQTARITPGPKPTYTLSASLDAINAAPLLQDFAGKGYLSGIGDFKLNIASGGTTIGDALKGLNGSVSSAFLKGAIEGFNLKQQVAQAKAKLRNEAAPGEGPPRTEFSDLKGAGKIVNGVLTTETLKASGTDYNLTGDGNIDLAGLTIDYVLRPTYTGGSGTVKDLGGVAIPVKITGSLLKPSVKVDLAGVLKDKVSTEVKQEIQKQEEKLKEKATKKLTDFFNKPKAAPAAPEAKSADPAPAPAQDKPAEEPPPAQ